MSASEAEAASSLSFLTVSLPMWLSLEIGSSSDGISCFFRFFVRLVTTCGRREQCFDVLRSVCATCGRDSHGVLESMPWVAGRWQ